MTRRNLRIRFALLGLGSMALLASPAFGDSLLLKDGRLIIGQVKRTEAGYVIRTRTGEQTFSIDDVQHWTHTESADADGPAPAAASTGSTGSTGSASVHAPAATPAAPSSPGKAGVGPGGAAKTTQQKSVAKLVERGNTALAGGDYKAARDAFADALLLEPHNPAAAQGLGYAYLRLTPPNYARARMRWRLPTRPSSRRHGRWRAIWRLPWRRPTTRCVRPRC